MMSLLPETLSSDDELDPTLGVGDDDEDEVADGDMNTEFEFGGLLVSSMQIDMNNLEIIEIFNMT